jgi:hypothetical protein
VLHKSSEVRYSQFRENREPLIGSVIIILTVNRQK